MANRRGIWALRLAVAGIALALVGVLLAWLRLVPGLVGFGLTAGGALLGALAVVGAVIALIRGGRGRPLLALGLGAGLCAAAVIPALSAMGLPRINDVTTDLDDPPPFVFIANLPAHRDRDLSYPEDFREPVREAYGHLAPRTLADTSVDAATARAAEALGALPHCEVLAVLQGRVEGSCETAVFGFVDDVVFRIRKAGSNAVVDVRSRSRVGRGDLGANARRIEQLLEAL